jgi:hypothetical protein
MAARDDFWLQIHDLSLLLPPHAADSRPRLEPLAHEIGQYPPAARKQLTSEFQLVARAVAGLEALLPAEPT